MKNPLRPLRSCSLRPKSSIMRFTRTLQIDAREAALLNAVSPNEALPHPTRVLSFPLQRLWFSSSALDGLVARHEVLRTTFAVDDGESFQRIGPAAVGLRATRDDLTAAAGVEAPLVEFMSHEAQATFDLTAAPLICAPLLRLAIDDHLLLSSMHKMISDDQSGNILARKFSELYTAVCEGRADQLSPLPVQYADYSVWQHRWLAGELFERQSEYRSIRAAAPTVLKLPADLPRLARQVCRDSCVEYVLREPLTMRLRVHYRRPGTKLFATLLAGSALVMARFSGRDELAIGAPGANDLSGDPPLETLLEQVNAALCTRTYQNLAFEQVIELANPPRNEARTAIFPSIISQAGAISVSCEDPSGSYHARNARATSVAPRDRSLQSRPINSDSPTDTTVMNFIEGPRVVSPGELQANSMTRYHVTRFYREQIAKSGYYDQLKYIVEPSFEEFESSGSLDTSGELDNTVVPGFQHKYVQTGLLLVTDRCASYCRYCFRKRFVGKDSGEIAADFAQIAEYIGGHPQMTNVLLSGGDPFMLSTARLDKILDHLLPFPHLESIRFGTKMVAYAPKRFEDPALPAMFQRIHEAGKAAVIVTHFDHIGEISVDAERNIRSLRASGVQFLNQTVLLGKVNDDAEILAATFAKCHQMGVRPYYLFQGRPVKGASHFQVSFRRGLEIVRGINQRLSGIQKTFKYIMSHYTGKIEILDLGADDRIYMRYHQSKASERIGEIFSRPHLDGAGWLDDLPDR